MLCVVLSICACFVPAVAIAGCLVSVNAPLVGILGSFPVSSVTGCYWCVWLVPVVAGLLLASLCLMLHFWVVCFAVWSEPLLVFVGILGSSLVIK